MLDNQRAQTSSRLRKHLYALLPETHARVLRTFLRAPVKARHPDKIDRLGKTKKPNPRCPRVLTWRAVMKATNSSIQSLHGSIAVDRTSFNNFPRSFSILVCLPPPGRGPSGVVLESRESLRRLLPAPTPPSFSGVNGVETALPPYCLHAGPPSNAQAKGPFLPVGLLLIDYPSHVGSTHAEASPRTHHSSHDTRLMKPRGSSSQRPQGPRSDQLPSPFRLGGQAWSLRSGPGMGLADNL